MDKERSLRDSFRYLLVIQRAFDRTTRPCGVPLSLPHAHALLELHASSEAITIKELARNLQIDRTNVSRLCQQMEESGELERCQSPEDKRAKILKLTEKGKALAAHVDQNSTKHFGAVTEILGEATDDVLGALDKLNQALRQVSKMKEKGEKDET